MVKKVIKSVVNKPELTYEKFIEDYQEFINELPELGDINKLPSGYFTNIRGFDYYQVFKHGDFKSTDIVLDVGSLHTFYCVYLAEICAEVHATDSFYWAERNYAKNLQSVNDWIDVVQMASNNKVLAYAMDVQYTQMSLLNKHFDYIVCISTVEHIHQDRLAIENMLTMLKDGGKLLLTTEYNETQGKIYSESDGSYYRVYDKSALDTLLEGLNVTDKIVCDTQHENLPFSTIFVEITN